MVSDVFVVPFDPDNEGSLIAQLHLQCCCCLGYAVTQLVEALRYKPSSKVAGSIPDGVIEIFH